MERHVTGIRSELATDAIEQSRLSGAVRSDKPYRFPRTHLEGDAVNSLDPAERLADSLEREQRRPGLSHWRSKVRQRVRRVVLPLG